MTPERYEAIRRIFVGATALSPDRRAAYLASACGEDAALRAEVEALLDQDSRHESFLESPALADGIDIRGLQPSAPLGDQTRIGSYEIVRVLGQGGMGVVYEARQDHPQRAVALKVIRPELTSPALLHRFKFEAEALGRLQHSGIAQIYEAGAADTGHGPQPFLAMELVKGQTLGAYCAARQLSVAARLRLIISICNAVQHAHQRGVIHRDLKPANILVDEGGRPKILDFGIARAAEADAHTTIAQTHPGQLVGTLAYMSPEQLSGDPEGVDTRCDVYSLGAICFELLADQLPHDLRDRTLPEAIRIVSEREPTRLSSVDASYRGDLETIVGKALEKDKARRYPSASELAADLDRYLKDQPISARPPSAVYTLRKFARRNRGLVAALAAGFVLLIAGIAGTSWQAVIAGRQRDRATLEADKSKAALEFVERMFTVDPDRDGREVSVFEVLGKASEKAGTELADSPEIESVVRATIGRTYQALGQNPESRRELERSLALNRELHGDNALPTALAEARLGAVLNDMGVMAEAERLFRHARPIVAAETGLQSEEYLHLIMNLGTSLLRQGDALGAEALVREALDSATAAFGESHELTLTALNSLATVLWEQNRITDTEEVLRRIVEVEQKRGLQTTAAFVHMDNLAFVLTARGKLDEAESMHRRALEGFRALLGEGSPHTLIAMRNLADLHFNRGEIDEAAELASKALAIERAQQGESQRLVNALNDLGKYRRAQGRYEEALELIREAVERSSRISGAENPETLNARSNLCRALVAMERFDDARREHAELTSIMRRTLGMEHLMTLMSLNAQALFLADRGETAEAAALLEEVVEAAVRSLPPDQWHTAMFQAHYGRILARQSKFEEAERQLLAGFKGLDGIGPISNRTVRAARDLAALYESWGRAQEADAWRDKAEDLNRAFENR